MGRCSIRTQDSRAHRDGESQVSPWKNQDSGWDPSPHPKGVLLTRSEPPMPMLMTSVMGLPEYPFQSPLRTRWHRAGRGIQPKPPGIKCCSKASLRLSPNVHALTGPPLRQH